MEIFHKFYRHGYTLGELLIVISLIGILAAALLAVLDPLTQMKKSRDSRRKTDLDRLTKVLEDYYNDKGKYPVSIDLTSCTDTSLAPRLEKSPCDPVSSSTFIYTYETDAANPTWYKIYTDLENNTDPAAVKIGCSPNNCTSESGVTYNWGVSSPNVTIGARFGSGGEAECSEQRFRCISENNCQAFGGDDPGGLTIYCGFPECREACYTTP